MIKKNEVMFLKIIGGFIFAFSVLLVPSFVRADFTPISGSTTMSVGSMGKNVRSLQDFMGSNSDMYPSNTQDGNFGPITKKGVVQFQLAYDLTADGKVGYYTRTRMNNVIAAGKGIDVYAPKINSLSVVPSGRNVNVYLNSSESVKATVFYDTNPINWNSWDDSAMSHITPAISGTRNTDDTYSSNKQFTLSNLSPNTVYNYTITLTDQSGNITVLWPTRFVTGS